METIIHNIYVFSVLHPILWWLLTGFLFVCLAVIALVLAVASILFVVTFFYMFAKDMPNAFAAIPIAIVVGYIAYCLGALAMAICPSFRF